MSQILGVLADFLADPWDDPLPFYHRMQEAGIVRDPEGRVHVTRYAHVDAIAREQKAKLTRNSGGRDVGFIAVDKPGPAHMLLASGMGFVSHDSHRRLRRLVASVFTPVRSTAWNGRSTSAARPWWRGSWRTVEAT